MSRATKTRSPRSRSRLKVTQRLRRSWISWRRRLTERRLTRAVEKHKLLLLELDSQLLRVKLLEQTLGHLSLAELELQEASLFRLQGQLPPPPPRNPEMDRLLGL